MQQISALSYSEIPDMVAKKAGQPEDFLKIIFVDNHGEGYPHVAVLRMLSFFENPLF